MAFVKKEATRVVRDEISRCVQHNKWFRVGVNNSYAYIFLNPNKSFTVALFDALVTYSNMPFLVELFKILYK